MNDNAASPQQTSDKPVHYGIDGVEGGEPFKNQLVAAKFKAKNMPQTRVVKAEGGFVLVDKSDKALAAEQDAGKRRLAAARAASRERNPFMAFLAEHGLFHVKDQPNSQKREFSPDKNPMVAGFGPVFRRDGVMPDVLAARAAQAGFLPPGTEDARAMEDLIQRAMAGERIAPLFAEGEAEKEMQARMQAQIDQHEELADLTPDDMDESGYARVNPQVQARILELKTQAEAAGVDVESLLEDLAKSNQNATQDEYDAAALQALDAAVAEPGKTGPQDRGQADGAASAESQGQAEGLTAPSEADVLAQQQRAAAAPALDEKAQIDREASVQTLTQQTAPEQRKDTTQDLLGGPTAEEALAAKKTADVAKAKPADDGGTKPMFARAARDSVDILADQNRLSAEVMRIEDAIGATTKDLNAVIQYGKRRKDKAEVAARIAEEEGNIAALEKQLARARKELAAVEREEKGIKPLDDVRNQQALFKRASITATPGSMKTAEIRRTLAPALSKLQLPHFIHNTTQDASKATGQAIPSDAKGFHWKGQIHLIAENIGSRLEAQEVFWHEVQHAGLNEALGTGSVKYENALRAISLQNRNVREAARSWMERHGQEEQDHWISRGKTAEEALKRAKLQAVDEALAEMSGRKGEKINGIAKFIAQVQQFLRSLGLHELAKWIEGKTNAEALSMILGAREAVLGEPSGRQQGQMAPAFSKEEAQFARGAERPVLRVDEHEKNIVWERGDYYIVIDSPTDAKYVTLWHNNKKVGSMSLGNGRSHDTRGYATISNVEIDAKHRGKGLGEQMYRTALRYVADHYKGIGGENEQRSNKRQVPAIYRKLGARKTESGDYVVDRNGAPSTGDGSDSAMAAMVQKRAEKPSFARAGATTRQYTPDQEAAMKHVGFDVEQPSVKERAKALWQDAGKKLAQGIVDQFAPVKDLDKQAYGLLRLAKGASGAFEAMLRGGQLKLTDGVYDIDTSKKGGVVDKLLIPLGGEHHDFMRWVAANRAERLAKEGKENLFSPADIAALKTLDTGVTSFDYTLRNAVHGVAAGTVTRDRTLIYRDSLAIFNEFNKNTLDMAEQSGLIDGASRHLWEHEFYVPFYRVADEADGGVRGMNIKAGVLRQQAFKQLKGGKGALNADLLDNTLMNWAHLLDAAAKNRAATATLAAAERVGLAISAPQYTAQSIAAATASKNGLVWVMDGGVKRYYVMDQTAPEAPYLMTAIGALEYAGMRSPVMNAMGLFKHALTVGVTASPFFKVRNLIRDSVQAIGTGPLSYNVAGNLVQGFKLTDPKSDAYFRLLAGGGTIHFGTMLEGSEARRVQALVESGVKDSTILNSDHKVKAFYRQFIEPGISAYNELGNRGEAINRASLYAQLTAQGMGHAEASLQARDLMDFSMQGSFTSIRFLTQVVPFFNARIQGLYKLGRAAKEDPARFSLVLGAAALMSVGLLAAYHDDDDWKKRELWDQQNFWWFKFGGEAFRIPKPFEIGAIATLAEHGAELAFSDEMTGKRFREAVLSLVSNNLSMNPIPQLVKPVLDVYSNQDSFSNRPIETMGMEHLKPEYRFNDRTSMLARGASTAANAVTGLVGADAPSPVQIDHLLRGYFGWLGSFVVGAGDVLARPSTGQPTQATPDYWKAATGGMVANLADAPSKYVSQMYTQAKDIEQAYGTWKGLLKEGKVQEAADFRQTNLSDLAKYPNVERIKRAEAFQNQQIKAIERADLPADVKRERIRQVQERKDRMARALAPS